MAARSAFDRGEWAETPERDRGALLLRVAELLVRDHAAYARAEALDTGKRLVEAEYDIADVISCFGYYGGVAGTEATVARPASFASSMKRGTQLSRI